MRIVFTIYYTRITYCLVFSSFEKKNKKLFEKLPYQIDSIR